MTRTTHSRRYPKINPHPGRQGQEGTPNSDAGAGILYETANETKRQINKDYLQKICDPNTQTRERSVEPHSVLTFNQRACVRPRLLCDRFGSGFPVPATHLWRSAPPPGGSPEAQTWSPENTSQA